MKQVDPAARSQPGGRPCRSTTSATFANSTAAAPAIPSMATRPASRRPPARLGQGIGNSVGMAIAARWLAAHYNRPGFDVFDYNVYAFCSDGDMMEGVAEAASVAGHLKLSNLCWTLRRQHDYHRRAHRAGLQRRTSPRGFVGYGWNVVKVADVNDQERLAQAIEFFRRANDAPTLIIAESHIGYGAPHKHATASAAALMTMDFIVPPSIRQPGRDVTDCHNT